MKIRHYGLTDIGCVRQKNEDAFDFRDYNDVQRGWLWIVADGVGGNNFGEIASQLAVEQIMTLWKSVDGRNQAEWLERAIIYAHEVILTRAEQNPALSNMATTSAVLSIFHATACVANVGDSRVYLIRDSEVHQLTEDQSVTAEMVRNGLISKQAALNHPSKNALSNAMGIKDFSAPNITSPFEVYENDVFVLCTDGLHNYLSPEELFLYSRNPDIQSAVRNLLNIAKDRGGKDNITVQLVSVFRNHEKNGCDKTLSGTNRGIV